MRINLSAYLFSISLFAVASLAQAGDTSSPVPGVMPLGQLVRQANALMQSGKPAEAYDLLEPREDDYSGETSFDYLLGIAALDSGKPDRATIAFERVLAVDPKFSGARVDLARAYFSMGSDDLAEKEFNDVLKQNPPPETAALIEKYLQAIGERRSAKFRQLSSYFETGIGYDDNITAATPDNVGGVADILGVSREALVALQYQPTGSSLKYSGMYAVLSGGVNLQQLISESSGLSLMAGANVKQRSYPKVSPMNDLNIDASLGLGVARGDDSLRVAATLGRYRQTGFQQAGTTNNDRDSIGLSAEWKHMFGANDQMIWMFGHSRPRYPSTPVQDTNQKLLSASWVHIFPGQAAPLLYASLNRTVDRALQPVNATTGVDMGRTGTGAMTHFQITPWPHTDLFLSAAWTGRKDASPGARSPGLPDVYAKDISRSINIGFTYRPWQKWSLKAAIASTDNSSNLSLYRYKRTDSSLSLRRDF
ncbi:MAG: tetratricopeptide repeat protein [Halothiobacillaceae bacterium]|nr:tetratricopeptide repeat protein [Halothiobacillaceae bacterium]